jgi:hypothetical protein
MTRNATFHGLHGWSTYLFEKFGWMLLAKNHGHQIQIDAYKHSLNELISHLNNKKKSLKDIDSKKDIQILLDNAKILKSNVDKIL